MNIKYKNNRDSDGSCSDMGYSAEEKFKKIAEKQGYTVVHASKNDQYKHIDFFLSKGEKTWKVDVKAAKRIRRKDESLNYDLIWIEHLNCRGDDGWVRGDADQIAFELENEFIIVSRKELRSLAEKLCDFEKKVDKAHKALYCAFKRFKRKDLLSLIKTSDLLTIKHKIWKKN